MNESDASQIQYIYKLCAIGLSKNQFPIKNWLRKVYHHAHIANSFLQDKRIALKGACINYLHTDLYATTLCTQSQTQIL